MRAEKLPREERLKRIQEVVRKREDNIIYVDLVFLSMYDAIDRWYKDNYQDDPNGFLRKGHLFQFTRRYDRKKFNDHNTLGKERDRFLEELDLLIQMRRID